MLFITKIHIRRYNHSKTHITEINIEDNLIKSNKTEFNIERNNNTTMHITEVNIQINNHIMTHTTEFNV